jgi:DNA (cytosine-5)-methyltransferase 1
MNTIKAIDFYCGAGGLTRGLLNAGIDVLYGIDADESARTTYEKNNLRPNGSQPLFLQRNMKTVTPEELEPLVPDRKGIKLLFAAGPPCQWFSKVNTIKDKSKKDRELLLLFSNMVVYFKPNYVLVENVPGVRYRKHGSIASKFTEKLQSIGYSIVVKLVDSKKYGVPQNRRRAIILASLVGDPGFPAETHRKGGYVTVRHAIGDRERFPKLNAGQAHSTIPNHTASSLSEKNLERIKRTPRNGGGRKSWSDNPGLKLKCYEDHTGHTDVYGRMKWSAPAPALTTRFNSLSNGRFGHPSDHRAITLREGAMLQTFPYEYVFFGTQGQIARHIGNAVPVYLAEVLGRHIVELTRKHLGSTRITPTTGGSRRKL